MNDNIDFPQSEVVIHKVLVTSYLFTLISIKF